MVATGNPISADYTAMRTMLLGGLLDAARHNVARDAERVAVFESGRVHLAKAPPPTGPSARGVFPGEKPPPAPSAPDRRPRGRAEARVLARRGRPADFYDLKGVLEGLCAALGLESPGAGRPALPAPGPGRARSRSAAPTRAGSASFTRACSAGGTCVRRRVRGGSRGADRGLHGRL